MNKKKILLWPGFQCREVIFLYQHFFNFHEIRMIHHLTLWCRMKSIDSGTKNPDKMPFYV